MSVMKEDKMRRNRRLNKASKIGKYKKCGFKIKLGN